MDINDFFSKVEPNAWIDFIGTIIGALIAAISIIVAFRQNKQQIRQQNIAALIPYYEALLESLPSYDNLMTQADYLDEKDNLLGSFTSPEGKLNILEKSLENTTDGDERKLLERKVKKQKEYLEYWNKANKKIEDFMSDGYYNAIKSACNGNIMASYYDLVNAFQNEHYYCGPVIDTDLLRKKFTLFLNAINKSKK